MVWLPVSTTYFDTLFSLIARVVYASSLFTTPVFHFINYNCNALQKIFLIEFGFYKKWHISALFQRNPLEVFFKKRKLFQTSRSQQANRCQKSLITAAIRTSYTRSQGEKNSKKTGGKFKTATRAHIYREVSGAILQAPPGCSKSFSGRLRALWQLLLFPVLFSTLVRCVPFLFS